ncbi:rRNA-processing protein las1, partial [Ascosphaera atra]
VWVWKLRGNLPHPVEATALLTDAILHDDPSKNSIFSIRATYSAAFCRFVTGFVDSKLYGPRMTMYQKAMTLGLPASFVELRHEATHREMPSLSVFRDATRRSLNWLWDFYWARLPKSQPLDESTHAKARRLLQPVAAQLAELTEGKTKKKVTGSLLSDDTIGELVALNFPDVAEVMLEEGMMIPKRVDEAKLAFDAWDDTLQEICWNDPIYLDAVVGVICDALLYPDEQPWPDSYYDCAFAWLEHLLNSKKWSMMRKLYFVLSYADIACEESKSPWASRVASLLLKAGEETSTSKWISDLGLDKKQEDDAMDVDGDTAPAYGWSVEQRWLPKPIGKIHKSALDELQP